MKISKKGFTLVEMVIVIIIVGILSVVSVSIYQHHREKAYLTEAFTMLRAIADANTLYYMETHTWVDDIRQFNLNMEGTETLLDGKYRIETKHFVYASAGDSSTSNTIATVNRKPFKERYWFSFAAVPNKQNPTLGKYELTGDATYAKSKSFDKELVAEFKAKYK